MLPCSLRPDPVRPRLNPGPLPDPPPLPLPPPHAPQDTWCSALKTIVKSSFKDIGKGWYNIHESNMETYNFSKLRRLLALVRFTMEDTMRFLVEESLTKYVAYIRTACAVKVGLRGEGSQCQWGLVGPLSTRGSAQDVVM